MRAGRLFLAGAVLLLFSTSLSGCWNRRELNTLAIVVAMGLDKAAEKGKVEVTVQIVKPGEISPPSGRGGGGGGTGGSQPVLVLTTSGETVFDAVRNAVLQIDRRLFWPHTKVVVVGEELARAGIAPLLDWIDRDAEPRRLSWLFVARGTARDVLGAEGLIERVPATFVENLAKATGAVSKASKVRLHDFLKLLTTEGCDPFCTGIEVFEEGSSPGGTQGDSTKNKEEGKRVKLAGTAVFKEDRLVGWLNERETRGLLWVLGKVKSGIVVVPAPTQGGGELSLEIIRARSRITPRLVGGQLSITVEIEEEANIGEQTSFGKLAEPEIFAAIEKKQAEVIEQEVKAALTKAQQELGVDVFGFGEAVHRSYPKEWGRLKARWREVYPTISVNVKASTKLRRMGLSLVPNVPR